MDTSCEIVPLHRQPTAVMRGRLPVERLPAFLETAFTTVTTRLHDLGVGPAGPPFTLYLNMDMRSLEVEAGFAVERSVPETDDVVSGHLDECEAATCVHIGSYETIGSAYDALMEWMQMRGHVGTGVAYEFYLNDPATTPPDNLRTQILFPLKPVLAPW